MSVVSKQSPTTSPQLATGNCQLPTPLVGREAELTQLHQWLEKTLKGARRIVFVTGEAGIGKTALVETFLQSAETGEREAGPVAARYKFIHALYQEVLYSRMTPGRRARLHQQIGEREETEYGERTGAIATELALHFEHGRDYERAVRYHHLAGENALQRSAYHEAIIHLRKGLALLGLLPDTAERARQELGLQIALGIPQQAVSGYASPEVEQTYVRALELCRQVGETARRFPILGSLTTVYQLRGHLQKAHALGEQLLTLAENAGNPTLLLWAHMLHGCTLHGFSFRGAAGMIYQGWALAEQGQGTKGVTQIQQGLAAVAATGAELARPYYLALLAEAQAKAGQIEKGLLTLAEALIIAAKNDDRFYEAELYRLKGQLTLQKLLVASSQLSVINPQSPTPNLQTEAEGYFHKAIEIAQRQQAKSLELRAATSLSRLWQAQGKTTEAQQQLAPVYHWFTEGFDTVDLQEAKILLEELW